MRDPALRTYRARESVVRAAGLVALVASAVLMALLSHPDWTPLQFDEMTDLAMGARLARGQTPYVDFHELRPPALVAWQGILFEALGPRLVAHRLAMLVAWTLAWWAAWRALRLVVPAARLGWATVACLGGWWTLAWWPVSYGHWWGAVVLILWTCCEVRRRLSASVAPALLAAWAVSLALLPFTCQTVAVAGLATLIASAATSRGGREARRSLVLHGAAACGVVAALLIALAALGLLSPAFRDAVLWPVENYKREGGYNDVSLAADLVSAVREASARRGVVAGAAALVSLALMTLALPASCAVAALARGGGRDGAQRGIALGLVLGAALAYLPGRQDLRHLAFVLPFAFLALGLALAGEPPSRGARAWRVALAAVALAGALMGVMPLVRGAGAVPGPQAWRDADAMYEGLVGVARRAAAANGGTLPVLSRGGLFEFYGVPLALPRSLLLPSASGYGSLADEQEVVDVMQRERPRWVLLYPTWEADAFLSGGGPLGELLRADYEPGTSSGDARFLRRRPPPR